MTRPKLSPHSSSVLSVVAAALAALLLGCGGGDAASKGSPTKAQYLNRANAICKRGLEEKDRKLRVTVEKEGGRGLLNGSPKEFAALVEAAVLPAYDATVSRLKSLPAPTQDQRAVDVIIERYEDGLRKTEANPALAAEENPFTQADKEAARFGLLSCTF